MLQTVAGELAPALGARGRECPRRWPAARRSAMRTEGFVEAEASARAPMRCSRRTKAGAAVKKPACGRKQLEGSPEFLSRQGREQRGAMAARARVVCEQGRGRCG